MGVRTTREIFFRPPALGRQRSALPAAIHNAIQLLLSRAAGRCLFIPIRSMQYQAVADREEIIFVDSQGGYAHQDGVGGRLIRIAWRVLPQARRESLSDPVPCEMIYYSADFREIQRRLVSEIQPALHLLLERQRERLGPPHEPQVIAFRRPA